MPLSRKLLYGLDLLHTYKKMPGFVERQMLLQGKILSDIVKMRTSIENLSDVEFSVFSQFGDDGIIQWLIHHLKITNRTFIEFGVSDYMEANTRFLLMNNNWSGLIMDGSEKNISRIMRSDYIWKHELLAKSVFITRENINLLLDESHFDPEVGLLHIDLDGMDYWVWKEISVISPVILILEYNSVFGLDRAITVPYDEGFIRTKSHYSTLYWGASLRALLHLSSQKGYSFIGCNSAGNNAYFIRKDKLNHLIREVSLEEGFVESKYRESLDQSGMQSFLRGKERLDILRGMPVLNVITGQPEVI
jgi:hypothetical protein